MRKIGLSEGVGAVSVGLLAGTAQVAMKGLRPTAPQTYTVVAVGGEAGRLNVRGVVELTPDLPRAFTYRACVVPNLAGKKLKAVRRALRKANCKLGKVKGADGGGARVKRQGKRAGKVLAPGSKVGVKLEAGRGAGR